MKKQKFDFLLMKMMKIIQLDQHNKKKPFLRNIKLIIQQSSLCAFLQELSQFDYCQQLFQNKYEMLASAIIVYNKNYKLFMRSPKNHLLNQTNFHIHDNQIDSILKASNHLEELITLLPSKDIDFIHLNRSFRFPANNYLSYNQVLKIAHHFKFKWSGPRKWTDSYKYLLIWIIVQLCSLDSRSDYSLTNKQWHQIARIFKINTQIIVIKWFSLLRTKNTIAEITQQQIEFIKNSQENSNYLNKWKLLSARLFLMTNSKVFRSRAQLKLILDYQRSVIKRGSWSLEEDRQLIEFINMSDDTPKYYELAKLLNRTQRQIRSRHYTKKIQNMIKKIRDQKKVEFTQQRILTQTSINFQESYQIYEQKNDTNRNQNMMSSEFDQLIKSSIEDNPLQKYYKSNLQVFEKDFQNNQINLIEQIHKKRNQCPDLPFLKFQIDYDLELI